MILGHGGLHEPGAGARQAGRSTAPTSGRSAACSTRCSPAERAFDGETITDILGADRAQGARLEPAAGGHARRVCTAAAPMPAEGREAAAARHRRRADRDRCDAHAPTRSAAPADGEPRAQAHDGESCSRGRRVSRRWHRARRRGPAWWRVASHDRRSRAAVDDLADVPLIPSRGEAAVISPDGSSRLRGAASPANRPLYGVGSIRSTGRHAAGRDHWRRCRRSSRLMANRLGSLFHRCSRRSYSPAVRR